jgi:hypothetical protein
VTVCRVSANARPQVGTDSGEVHAHMKLVSHWQQFNKLSKSYDSNLFVTLPESIVLGCGATGIYP